MRMLVLIALVGLAAQLVDGGLGMAYGVTTSTLLLTIGANPAAASATVHLAEVGTTLVSGLSHWRFGNVDWGVVAKIGIPGAIGAFLGATALSNLDAAAAKPFMSAVLLALGLFILVRFTLGGLRSDRLGRAIPARLLTPLGLFAGFMDAAGGGGWGPVGTPALLADGRLEPRKVVGSINSAEFLVTVAASLGFLFSLGSQGITWSWVLALLIGGAIAAPIAAALVRCVPARVLGPAVGGLIVLTNARTLLGTDALGAPEMISRSVLLGIAVLWLTAIGWAVRQHRAQSQSAAESGSSAVAQPQTVPEHSTSDERPAPAGSAR